MFLPHLFPGVRMRVMSFRSTVLWLRTPRFLVGARHFSWLSPEGVYMRFCLLEVVSLELGSVLIERNGMAEVADCGVGCCER